MSVHSPAPPSHRAAAYDRMRRAGSTAYGASLDLNVAQEYVANVLHDLQSAADATTVGHQAERLRCAADRARQSADLLAQAADEMTGSAAEVSQ